jgi:hypothetical protein
MCAKVRLGESHLLLYVALTLIIFIVLAQPRSTVAGNVIRPEILLGNTATAISRERAYVSYGACLFFASKAVSAGLFADAERSPVAKLSFLATSSATATTAVARPDTSWLRPSAIVLLILYNLGLLVVRI